MRVAVFGAAGQLGRRVMGRLAAGGRCSFILAADRDARGLAGLQARFGAGGAAVRYLEAADERSVRERMAGVDAVISCLGSNGGGEGPAAAEALREGKVFLSSSDHPGQTEALLVEAGLSDSGPGLAVMGLGWSPGLSNLLALRAAEGFDRLDSLEIFWSVAAAELRSPGGQERMLRGFRGKCLSFEGGRAKEVRGGSWEEWTCFPPGIGWTGTAYSCQTEPLTLPGRFPGVLQVKVKGGLNIPSPPYLVHTIAWASHLLPEHLQELLNHGMGLALNAMHRTAGENRLSGLRVEARGIKGGQVASVALGASGAYLDTTAGLLTSALPLLLEGGPRRGLLPPEDAFTLADLLPALRREGVRFWSPSPGVPPRS